MEAGTLPKNSRKEFQNLIKSRIQIKASEYLQTKRGSKGKYIKFTNLEMSECIMPFNSEFNIEEKKIFEFRNGMARIPSNFGIKEEKCLCGVTETMDHIHI